MDGYDGAMPLIDVGPPSGEDAAALQAAFDAAADGGMVVLDPAAIYTIDSTLVVRRDVVTQPVIIDGRGAQIRWADGAAGATMIEYSAGGSHGTHDAPAVRDLRLDGTGVATTGFRWTDAGKASFRDVTVDGVAGPAWHLRNEQAFSENQTFLDIRVLRCAKIAFYEGAADTGGPGKASFARAHWQRVLGGRISDVWFDVAGGAAVYDSVFDHVKGNLMAGAGVFRWRNGAAGGTVIWNLKVEQGDEHSYLFDMDYPGNGPIVGPNIPVRSSIHLFKPGSATDESHFGRSRWLAHDFPDRRAAGAGASASAGAGARRRPGGRRAGRARRRDVS